MKHLLNLIQINRSFQKSVNLQLDLEDYERIGSYIPTRSSVAILKRYLENVSGKNSNNATILIGPYGKGKSHLLLVLLAILHGKHKEITSVTKKIAAVDEEAGKMLQAFNGKESKKYLPVLISANSENTLNQSFIVALREALIRDGLEDVAPESNYSEAISIIENWKKNYPVTYELLKEKTEVKALVQGLKNQSRDALHEFKEIYPSLTSGSRFAPMMHADALKIYQQINRILVEEYGYSGMFLVFDEFSKYLEGHGIEHFADDMKTLQDMCELCNNSKRQMFITMVAHKSIHEYTRGIDESVKNAFRGVEGRIYEIEFIVSVQNNYELIADTIVKREPEFSAECGELFQKKEIRDLLEESYSLPVFDKNFTQEEFIATIGMGCFPMTPICACALLFISEKVAQNERTIFTFLSDEGQGSLSWLLAKGQTGFIGVDKIYDYFKSLFRENNDQPLIHREWQKAEYAISKAETSLEVQILKAIAIIRMIHREDELPARDRVLRLSLACNKEEYEYAMQSLIKKNLLRYRNNVGIYDFRTDVGIDVEAHIERKMAELRDKIAVCDTLKRVSDFEYELPKKYNQKYAITRYFKYEYMEKEDFLRIRNSSYLFEEHAADGRILILLHVTDEDVSAIQKTLQDLKDSRIVVLLCTKSSLKEEGLLKYAAIRALKNSEDFIEGNEVLLQELSLYEEDLVYEINSALGQDYLPENGKVRIFGTDAKACKNSAELNQMLSEICEAYYGFSPRVNHELLNIEVVGAQYLKARNTVIRSLLLEEDCSKYLSGTSPDSMVYRATFVHTQKDLGCEKIAEEMNQFFSTCSGKRQSFADLYTCLQGKKYGARRGIIPLFLAKKLADIEGTAVIYLKNKEMEVTAETLNNVNDFPEKYELYIEPETVAKDEYLKGLEEVFCEKGSFALSKQSRINGIVLCMQKWYRSLPQYAMVANDYPQDVAEVITVLRGQLRRAEINPRELLFDKLPSGLQEEDYSCVLEKLKNAQEAMNQKLSQMILEMSQNVREEFDIAKEANLKAGLTEWYQKQSQAAKKHILSTRVSSLMNYLEQLQTNDEEEIIARLSRIVLDIYVEDWNDDSKEAFVTELHQIRIEVESILDKEEESGQKSRLILQDAKGNEIAKYYDADVTDSTSIYLQNMIDEALEDFGDTLEMNQKVAVLVQAIEKLLQQ